MVENPHELPDLLRRASEGDRDCWGALLARHEERLRRMISLHLDRRLRGRLGSSDVLQEVYLEASARLPEYLREPSVPFFLWLRLLAGQKLVTLQRRHLATHMRDVRREVSLDGDRPEPPSSADLAELLLSSQPRPSETAVRNEVCRRLQEALDGMEPLDREVLTLRHFEQLSNAETARVLGVREGAASKRYIRALDRLREVLAHMPGGLEEVEP